MSFAIVLTFSGIISLFLGAYFFVEGSIQLAKRLHFPPLFIGITVAAIGTSSPELFFTAYGAYMGEGDVILGNIIGSNLFNTMAILGIASLYRPLVVRSKIVKWDVPFCIGASAIFWMLGTYGHLTLISGVFLILAYIAYTYFTLICDDKAPIVEISKKSFSTIKTLCYLAIGIAILLLGSELLIGGVVRLGNLLIVSPYLISLLVVSIGTSLPELAVTLQSIHKNEVDFALGNVLGSNLFNILFAGGIAGIFSIGGLDVPHTVQNFDLPILFVSALFLFPLALTHGKLSRWEGGFLLFYYIFYCAWVIVRAVYAPWQPILTQAFIYFVIPITLIAFIDSLVRHFKARV